MLHSVYVLMSLSLPLYLALQPTRDRNLTLLSLT